MILAPENIPEGLSYKGYQPFTVQEINIIAKEITYKLEVWEMRLAIYSAQNSLQS